MHNGNETISRQLAMAECLTSYGVDPATAAQVAEILSTGGTISTEPEPVLIGNRYIKLHAAINASFNSGAQNRVTGETFSELILGFGHDDYLHFYGEEADLCWQLLTDHLTDLKASVVRSY